MADRFAVVVPEGISLTSPQVKLVEWAVAVGDQIKRGDTLCEVETEKATLPVEATDPGVLVEIVAEAGVDLQIGDTIAWMEA